MQLLGEIIFQFLTRCTMERCLWVLGIVGFAVMTHRKTCHQVLIFRLGSPMEKSSSLMDVSYQQMRVCVYNCESCFACAEQLTFVCSRQTRTWQQQQQLLCALPLIFCALRSTKRPPPPFLEVENSTRPTFHASIARMAHSTLWTYPLCFSKEHWHRMEKMPFICVV